MQCQGWYFISTSILFVMKSSWSEKTMWWTTTLNNNQQQSHTTTQGFHRLKVVKNTVVACVDFTELITLPWCTSNSIWPQHRQSFDSSCKTCSFVIEEELNTTTAAAVEAVGATTDEMLVMPAVWTSVGGHQCDGHSYWSLGNWVRQELSVVTLVNSTNNTVTAVDYTFYYSQSLSLDNALVLRISTWLRVWCNHDEARLQWTTLENRGFWPAVLLL